MKVVIVGSQGFVGRYLYEAVAEQSIAVVGVDQVNNTPQKNFIQLDITDFNAVQTLPLHPNDIVVHLAARQYAHKPPRRQRQHFFDEVNVSGLHNILKTMQNKACQRLIYFSSDMIYGLPLQVPISIQHPHNPLAEYGRSKKKAEQLCENFRAQGFSICIFRPRLIVGPGRLGVLRQLFRCIEKNWPIPLIGTAENYYQMVSVFDCISAIQQAIARNCPNGTFNLGSENLISIYDLLSAMIQQVGSSSKLIRLPAQQIKWLLKILGTMGIELLYPEQYQLADQLFYLNIEDTKQQLGWQPQYNDQQMMLQAYQWYLKNAKE